MLRRLGGAAVLAALVLATAARADDKEMKALLDRAIKAHGGAEKLDKYLASTMTIKGKVNVMGQDIDFEGQWSVQLPDRMRNEIELEIMNNKIKQVTVLNKDKGWISALGTTTEMTKEMLDEAREDMHSGSLAGQLTPLTKKGYKLSPLGETKVNGRPAIGMLVQREGSRDFNMYFDKKDGLLVKTEGQSKDFQQGGKEVSREIIYSDYKDYEGMKIASRMQMKQDGKDFLTGEISNVKVIEKLNDDVFTKPE
jgi:hypothetical protein